VVVVGNVKVEVKSEEDVFLCCVCFGGDGGEGGRGGYEDGVGDR
jgi:hypothetical protein